MVLVFGVKKRTDTPKQSFFICSFIQSALHAYAFFAYFIFGLCLGVNTNTFGLNKKIGGSDNMWAFD